MTAKEADIREALAAYLTQAAEAEEVGLTTERRFRMLRGINRSERLAIMGDDLYYLEVLPTGMQLADQAPDRSYRDRIYTYNAALHHRYQDADTYAAASQSTWDPIQQAVVEAVAEGSFLPTAGNFAERVDLEMEGEGGTLDIQPLDQSYQDVVHTLAMTLTCSA